MGYTEEARELSLTSHYTESFVVRRVSMASAFQLQRIVRIIGRGGVIGYPTEAVWGLGCDPWNAEAVERLLALKRRPWQKGLILVAAHPGQFDALLQALPEKQQAMLNASWPGPATWLVPHRESLPFWITGEHETVAIRVSAHPLIQALCAQTGPLVSTSANPANHAPAQNRWQLERYFHRDLDGILGGTLGGERRPSVIRELTSGRVIRA